MDQGAEEVVAGIIKQSLVDGVPREVAEGEAVQAGTSPSRAREIYDEVAAAHQESLNRRRANESEIGRLD